MKAKLFLLVTLLLPALVQACPLGECIADCKNKAGEEKRQCRLDCVDKFGDETESSHQH